MKTSLKRGRKDPSRFDVRRKPSPVEISILFDNSEGVTEAGPSVPGIDGNGDRSKRVYNLIMARGNGG